MNDKDEQNHLELDMPVLAGVEVPSPVFFCSIEPPSMSHQKALDHALECLQKEDPSLKVCCLNNLKLLSCLQGLGVVLDRVVVGSVLS